MMIDFTDDIRNYVPRYLSYDTIVSTIMLLDLGEPVYSHIHSLQHIYGNKC